MEQIASAIWDELKRYINVVDRAEAAENLVSVLVDNDCDPDEIKSAFAGDLQIKNALSAYINDDQEEYINEDDEDIESEWED